MSLDYDQTWLQSRWRSDVRKRLTAWFAENAREMPWRSEPTPYRVWVSEVMLQQTQVATVIPYFQRWMQSFPTIVDVANADESELMRHWEGLGYYRRVRSLQAAAKKIVSEHDGEFPDDFESVLALPGVGRYTAGAVLSISKDARLPILEGNTQRVFSRWIGLRNSPVDRTANSLLWDFATKMLPRQRCGQFNQAAMELGALICTPKNPDCEHCPVRVRCTAAGLGLQEQIPGKIKNTVYQDRVEFALVIPRHPNDAVYNQGQAQYLIRRLPDGARWAGLWDFPRPTASEMDSVVQAGDWLGGQLDCDVSPGPRLSTLRHAVTKFRITLHVHAATIRGVSKSDFPEDSDWQWLYLSQINELAMSVTGRKIARLLSENAQSLLPFG